MKIVHVYRINDVAYSCSTIARIFISTRFSDSFVSCDIKKSTMMQKLESRTVSSKLMKIGHVYRINDVAYSCSTIARIFISTRFSDSFVSFQKNHTIPLKSITPSLK